MSRAELQLESIKEEVKSDVKELEKKEEEAISEEQKRLKNKK